MVSVRTKITVLLLLFSIVPLLFLGGYIYFKETSDSVSNIERVLSVYSGKGVSDLELKLFSHKRDLQNLASFPSVARFTKSLIESSDRDVLFNSKYGLFNELLPSVRIYDWLDEVMVSDLSGDVLLSTLPLSTRTSFAGRAHFLSALNGEVGVSNVLLSSPYLENEAGVPEIGVPTLFISVPIRGEAGIVGVLTGRIDVFELMGVISHSSLPFESLDMYVVNEEGVVISKTSFVDELKKSGLIRVRPELELRAVNPFNGEFISIFAKTLEDGSSAVLTDEYVDYRGVSVVGASKKVEGVPWYVIVEVDSGEAFGELNVLLVVFALTIFSFGVLGTLLSLSFGRLLSLPIRSLHDAVIRVRHGDFSKRVDIKTGDELEQLGVAFNEMSSAIGAITDEHKQIEDAKTKFLTITSHELRSPMTPMKAQLQMLSQGYFGRLSGQQRESVDTIVRNADRLDKIIVDFLEISRIEAGRLKFDFKKVNLSEVAREVVELMKSYLPEKQISIVLRAEKLPVIEADPDRVSQVLRNLLSNAIKFSPVKSQIDVFVSSRRDGVLFCVRDRGVGISPADQSRLFEPFFQAESTWSREHGGTGLGLAICRGIVQSQNGKIWAESVLGKGSSFFFTVPLVPVREAKPLRILFASSEANEQAIAVLFKDVMGPMGEIEFEHLKRVGLTEENLITYLAGLRHKNVIDASTSTHVRSEIKRILKASADISVEEKIDEALKKNV